ncbi:MAG: NAD(P)H-dependent oxidoreductase [Methanomicrobiales archaeon]|nr:NAD(P)H-dependent oxidoreductase [Methanomicrobiales archaeon]
MAVVIVYHSETGQTRLVAEQAAKRTGAVLIPVKDQANYNAVTRYLIGARQARNNQKARIDPSEIDVALYDGIVVGSPVWAWHPTPAINAAIDALRGCERKPGLIFTTSGGMPGETVEMMKTALTERGVDVLGTFHFSRKELQDPKKIGELVSAIIAMHGASSG